MSKLKSLLQWYKQPVGILWLIAAAALLVGTITAWRPLIATGIGLLVLVLLPYKDQQNFLHRRAAQRTATDALEAEAQRFDQLGVVVDEIRASRAREKKEMMLLLNDHQTDVDRHLSALAADQVIAKHNLAERSRDRAGQ